MNHRWLLTLLAFSLLTQKPLPAEAETQTITATHTYVMGDDDSRDTARQKCLAEANRKILEQVGVYLESHSELLTSSHAMTSGSAKSPQATNEDRQQITEQISTFTAGLMRTEAIKEEFGEANVRLQITLTVKAEVDPDDIQKQLAARHVDQHVRKQVSEQEQRLAQLEEQLRTMLKEMRTLSGDQIRLLEQQGKDTTDADVATIRARARKGDGRAQTILGIMYQEGRDVPQNYVVAVDWYRKAAAQGDSMAMFLLGLSYFQGLGAQQDFRQAVQWYRKAAEAGNAEGQAQLGFMYANGWGVAKDKGEAVRWFTKAAEAGNPLGQSGLGLMYASGSVVNRDDVRAYMWYDIAASNQSEKRKKDLSLKDRDHTAVRLSPQQLAQAQRLAQKCKASNYKDCD